MNSSLFILALFEIIFSIIITVGIIYVSYRMLQRLFFKGNDLSGNHLAFTIFTSGVILNIGLILSEILPSITQVVRLATTQGDAPDYKTIILYSGLYLLIGFLISVIINGAVFLLFSILTQGINEYAEIKNNNMAVAIIVATTLISITLIVKDSIAVLVSALLPYPQAHFFL
ncbi:MAG: DUF350 domain-containing protein [Flavobacteriaceae bacterium]|jgi:hypothetical protein|nr:DUF350 domain-containing protein [Flavobacteriaceae bacterium]MDG1063011.1 DUF350 domain-containing protein [Flavobacteriaceae bacterium]MDG1962863.1 DUF350 domain-containing protein [Flavobacteriaceae bacterium]